MNHSNNQLLRSSLPNSGPHKLTNPRINLKMFKKQRTKTSKRFRNSLQVKRLKRASLRKSVKSPNRRLRRRSSNSLMSMFHPIIVLSKRWPPKKEPSLRRMRSLRGSLPKCLKMYLPRPSRKSSQSPNSSPRSQQPLYPTSMMKAF